MPETVLAQVFFHSSAIRHFRLFRHFRPFRDTVAPVWAPPELLWCRACRTARFLATRLPAKGFAREQIFRYTGCAAEDLPCARARDVCKPHRDHAGKPAPLPGLVSGPPGIKTHNPLPQVGSMRVLHTSDWHIGATLCEKTRYEEHRAFFQWLTQTIVENRVEALLVAGDVFDTSSPSNRAVTLYFEFLQSLRSTPCRHVVIIGGNHDSPSQLNAPAGYLACDGIHVLGCARPGGPDGPDGKDGVDGEVLVLRNEQGVPGLIVCAVPFLRDRDVREAAFGQDPSLRTQFLCQGILAHYARVAERARERAAGLERPCPIVAMGHFFATGAAVRDGEDSLTVGTLGAVDASSLARDFAYTALGHIHTPQRIGCDQVRYSGSPLAMSFGEKANKVVLLVEFDDAEELAKTRDAGREHRPDPCAWPVRCTPIPVPVFQPLVHVQGTVAELEAAIRATARAVPGAWVEADYTGKEPLGTARERIFEAARDASGTALIDIVRLRDLSTPVNPWQAEARTRELADYTPKDIFNLCLEARQIASERRPALCALFDTVLASLNETAEDRACQTGQGTGQGTRKGRTKGQTKDRAAAQGENGQNGQAGG